MKPKLFQDIVLVLALSVLTLLFVLTPVLNETPLRVVFGICFVLFLPGYALIAALFPKRDDLDAVERIALSFGLSIAIVPLVGLALNYTPFGIRLVPVVLSIALLTMGLCALAHVRRMELAEDKRLDVDFRRLCAVKGELAGGSRLDRALTIVLVVAIVLAIATTVYVVVMPKQGERFTEFYILNENGMAADYPTHLVLGEQGTVIVGIVNHEYAPITYRLEIRLNGAVIHTQDVFLNDKERWEKPITFKPTKRGEHEKLEFLLYKDGKVYRSLHLWVDVI